VTALDDLLAIQDLDTMLDQLRHRRATLPELAALEQLGRDTATVGATRDEVAGRLHAVRSAQKEAEDHASLLEDKAREVNTSMYDGSVAAHKELEALAEEHTALQQRQGEFEDRALELMEEAEPIEGELAIHEAAIAELAGRTSAVEADLLVAQTELDVEIDRVATEREAAASAVPDEMLVEYESRRAGLGGMAVARLHGARCEGCHLEIPSAELEDVRRAPADALVSCPECMRILVR
jgi:predicted  nucleic acid-binding Zn-ribbon protein